MQTRTADLRTSELLQEGTASRKALFKATGMDNGRHIKTEQLSAVHVKRGALLAKSLAIRLDVNPGCPLVVQRACHISQLIPADPALPRRVAAICRPIPTDPALPRPAAAIGINRHAAMSFLLSHPLRTMLARLSSSLTGMTRCFAAPQSARPSRVLTRAHRPGGFCASSRAL